MSLTPSNVLRLKFNLEEQMLYINSPLGNQLSRLKQGTQSSEFGTQKLAWEKRPVLLSDLHLLTRSLTSQELQVCRLRYKGGNGVQNYIKLVSSSDLIRYDFPDNTAQLLTIDGEEPISLKALLKSDGPVTIEVRGKKAKMASFSQIASHLNITARAAKTIFYTALAKIKVILQQQEEREAEGYSMMS